MKTELEYVSCANGCDEAAAVRLHNFDGFSVCRCGACDLVYLTPRLHEAQLEAFYADEYFSGGHEVGYDSYEKDRPLYEKTFARRLKFIRRFKPAGKLLDVGCGLGFFLDVAQRWGFESWGLDCSRYAAERCRERFPGKIRQGFLRPGLFPEKYFDVVSMFDLFEHVYHPREFLRAVHRIIKDDGIVIITTPNYESALSLVSGRRWVSYKIPEHVYYYTPRTLGRMVGPLFEVALVRSEGQYCSVSFLAERTKTLSRPLGGGLLRAAHYLGAEGLPVYVNSGSMTAVLRKSLRAAGAGVGQG